MNQHLPALPHGQPPLPPSRRQHEMHYASVPPNIRSPPAYMGYHPLPNGHGPPPYTPQSYHQWYTPYPQMQAPLPAAAAAAPPRPYQAPYTPLIVSSYPHSPYTQPVFVPANVPPPPALPLQSRTAASTPRSTNRSSSPVGSSPSQPEVCEKHSADAGPVTPRTPVVNPSPPLIPEQVKTVPATRDVFRAPLPWLSVPGRPFPARAPHKRRKSRSLLRSSGKSVEFPAKETQRKESLPLGQTQTQCGPEPEPAEVTPSEPQTPTTTSHAPSETDSTQPTTPSSVAPVVRTPTQQSKISKPSVPLVPVVPILPPSPTTPRNPSKDGRRPPSETSITPKSSATLGAEGPATNTALEASTAVIPSPSSVHGSEEPATVVPPPRAPPKSWADLVRSKAQPRVVSAQEGPASEAGGLAVSKSESMVDVLNSLGANVDQYSEKIAFLEPRGLVNTGNMCYMNSVLQVLLYCVPFYQLLDHVGRRAPHSFKSDLPLIDAMILFMKEFRIIDAARSEEQLRLRLKHSELEEYGEAFTPEYVYQVIRQLPRFRDMRRGHQQDAQEFLGFLLEELHEECCRAMRSGTSATSGASTPTGSATSISPEGSSVDGWLEVGHKQRPAVTRSSGHIALESPITKIFGGKLRSEFRVPGNKNSVTLEPYQPLQLDIGSPDVNNIIDALKGLTKPETIHGDFNSSRGPKLTATKQIFIESLPPVLILHLKRFQYDNVTKGTQKIWKKVGYPLELVIPREVFPPHRRNALAIHGDLPKYRLIGVIYHHGKNAGGGHYTVDVRRQDGREWVRLDDTTIRRLRSEEVAEAGGEEDPKLLAAALEQHKRDKNPNLHNIYDQFDNDEHDPTDTEKGWSQVNGAGSIGHSSKKSISANGVASPPASGALSGKRTPVGRYGARDSKVAYLLFYQRININ
ncbi:hypothetical protein Egran_03583 [Elaphomyces granulatus]|uniref:Ubiquitin carboxyl-terminal hydrolase n=1 Tax=Elaphomyces granulatus TaxID=519963 RepID=A0A232LX45_9EURO|nr:hypothetical protein Egran_03583 [Elaphomyces granulatus]